MFFCHGVLPKGGRLASPCLKSPPLTLSFSVGVFLPLARVSCLKGAGHSPFTRYVCHIYALTPECVAQGSPQGRGARISWQSPT
jgi:hypothetical protein